MKRALLVSTTLLLMLLLEPIAGVAQIQPLPTGGGQPALLATMQANAQASGEWDGSQLKLLPGMITPGQGSLTDASGAVWTLPAMGWWPAGNVARNGQEIPGGWFTAAAGLDQNGQVVFESAKRANFWTYNGSGFTQVPDPFGSSGGGAASAAPVQTSPVASLLAGSQVPTTTLSSGAACTATSATTGMTQGQFTTQNGQIIGPDGQVFVARGLSILDAKLDQAVGDDGNPLLSLFPGINFVRIAVNGGYDPTVGEKAVLLLTGRGIVVVFTNYNGTPGGPQTEITGSDLQQATDWYASLAKKYQNNPHVWFNTLNEPTNNGGSISAEHKAVYDAIRGAGNNNIVMFDLAGGGPSTDGLDLSIYSDMHNVAWDPHYYAWVAGKGNTDPNAHRQALAKEIAAVTAVNSMDGAMPAIVGEWGDATDGANIDPAWQAVAQAVTEYSGGQAAWLYDGWGQSADRLVASNSLTPLGSVVATAISYGPTPTLTPSTNCNMATNGNKQPGAGSGAQGGGSQGVAQFQQSPWNDGSSVAINNVGQSSRPLALGDSSFEEAVATLSKAADGAMAAAAELSRVAAEIAADSK